MRIFQRYDEAESTLAPTLFSARISPLSCDPLGAYAHQVAAILFGVMQ